MGSEVRLGPHSVMSRAAVLARLARATLSTPKATSAATRRWRSAMTATQLSATTTTTKTI